MNKRKRIKELEAEVERYKKHLNNCLDLGILLKSIELRSIKFSYTPEGYTYPVDMKLDAIDYEMILVTPTCMNPYDVSCRTVDELVEYPTATLFLNIEDTERYLKRITEIVEYAKKEAINRHNREIDRKKIKEQVKKYKDIILEVLAEEK